MCCSFICGTHRADAAGTLATAALRALPLWEHPAEHTPAHHWGFRFRQAFTRAASSLLAFAVYLQPSNHKVKASELLQHSWPQLLSASAADDALLPQLAAAAACACEASRSDSLAHLYQQLLVIACQPSLFMCIGVQLRLCSSNKTASA